MSNKSLGQILRKWVARGTRMPAPRPTAKLRLEEVEQRVVPATLPEPTAVATRTVPNFGAVVSAPQVIADPTNPNTLIGIASVGNGVIAQVSFDAGVTWNVFRDTRPTQADPSGGKLFDPNLPNNGTPRIQKAYTNASNPTVAITRGIGGDETSGSIYVAYLEHNANKTSGALVVERFDLNRTTQAITPYDLDPNRDWDDDTSTPATPQHTSTLGASVRANGSKNRAAILQQWVDDGVTTNRPLNVYVAVDTNRPSFTDAGLTVTDPFASYTQTTPSTPNTDPTTVTGGDTVFVAWNTDAAQPTVQTYAAVNAVAQLGYTPNAVFVAVGRVDPNDVRNRPNPDAAISATNHRQAVFGFSTPVPVDDGGHFLGDARLANGGAAPIITFTPGSLAAGAPTAGQMSVVWQSNNDTGGRGQIAQSTAALGAAPATASYLFRSSTLPTNRNGTTAIGDAFPPPQNGGNFDISTATEYELPVDLTVFPDFDALTGLEVTVAMTENHVQDVSVELVSPDGATTITLVNNRLRGDGQTNVFNGITAGITGNDLGVAQGSGQTLAAQVRGNPVGTVFTDEAPRQIHDPVNPAKYIGTYRPEIGSLATFYGQTAAALSSRAPSPGNVNNPTGNWLLRITDFRADRIAAPDSPPRRYLEFWSINFTARTSPTSLGTDRFVSSTASAVSAATASPAAGVSINPPTAAKTVPFGADQTYATSIGGVANAVSPVFGIGPGVSVAYDTSLGAYSRFAGRMYVAYTAPSPTSPGDTNVYLLASDTNGATWFRPMGTGNVTTANGIFQNVPIPVNDDSVLDSFSEGRRVQYDPTVTVDPATGTVVVMWYDARNDASNSRAATYVSTSIDGGATFSPQAFANPAKKAVDAVTGDTVTLEPVPSNVAAMPLVNAGAYQYGGTGIRQSLLAYGGVIRPFFVGNANTTGAALLTADLRTAAGPRVVSSDLGAVSEKMVDADPAGGQLQTGAIMVRDENGNRAVITDAFGNTRTRYNDQVAADGTRLLDGFRVVFDRPIYFDPSATPSDDSFSAADVEVRFRGTSGLIATGTQGALVPVRGVVPINPITINGATFATAFFVQFQTPQSAVGTYSYAVGPNVSDRIRSNTTATYSATDAPKQLADPGTVDSTITVPKIAGDPRVEDLRVVLNINHTFLSDLSVSLIGPDPDGAGPLPRPQILLFSGEGANQADIINMRLSDAAANPPSYQITNPFNHFNGLYSPAQPLATFAGSLISGDWTLRVTDSFETDTGTIQAWGLTFRDATGAIVPISSLGNAMDQDADSVPAEVDNDRYSAPGSTSGAPFSGPFDPATKPLVDPGAHVVRTYAAATPPVTTAAAPVSAFQFTLTKPGPGNVPDPRDATSLALADITVTGPAGAVIPSAVIPLNDTATGVTSQFGLTFDTALPAGTYTVRITGRNSFTVAYPSSSINVLRMTLDREADASTLTAAGVNTVTGPSGPVTLTRLYPINVVDGGTKTVLALASAGLPAGAYSATFNSRVFTTDDLILNGTTNAVYVRFDRDMNPASFTAANVLRITGPTGPISTAGVSITPVAADRTELVNATAARLFRVSFTQPQVIVPVLTVGTSGTALPFTLTAAPVGGDLKLADVLRLVGPNGPVSLSGATLTGTGTSYSLNLPANLPVGQYRIDLNATPGRAVALAPQFVATRTTAGNTLAVTLTAPPTGGTLLLSDVVRVTGPAGAVSTANVTITQSGLTYTLTFPNTVTLPAGSYLIDLTPAAARGIAVAGSGVFLSGSYAIEFGSDPNQADSNLAAIRAVDGSQLSTALTSPTTVVPVTLTATPPGGLTNADILRVIGPTGSLDTSRVVIGGTAPNYTASYQPAQAVVTTAAGATSYGVTLVTPPTGAPLTAADLVAASDPSGPIDKTRVVISGSLTSYTVKYELPRFVGTAAAGDTALPIQLAVPATGGLLTNADLVSVRDASGPIDPSRAVLTGGPNNYSLSFELARLITTQPAAFTDIPITLTVAPTGGDLTIADVFSMTDQNGQAVDLGNAFLTGAGTSYTLSLQVQQLPGRYQINFNGTNARNIRVAGSEILAGDYRVEFNPSNVRNIRVKNSQLLPGQHQLDFDPSAARNIRVAGYQLPAGQYVFDFNPSAARNIHVAGSGLAVDNNLNAGLDLVLGKSQATAGTPTATVIIPTEQAFLDVTFVTLNGALLSSDILTVRGPDGLVSPSGAPQFLGGMTYRIPFAAPLNRGQYTIEFTTAASRNISFGNGQRAPIAQQVFPSASLPVAIPVATGTAVAGRAGKAPGVAEMAIDIADDFVITQDDVNQIQVLLNLSHPNDADLKIELVPPASANLDSIVLYDGKDAQPFTPGQTADFVNTVLVDRPNDPLYPLILTGQPSYSPGVSNLGYTPQNPLSVLVGASAHGRWTLRVSNFGFNTSPSGSLVPPPQINNWQLTLPRAVPSAGVGERVSDRFTAGFRVYTLDPTNPLSRESWTAVGAASANEGANAGSVTAVAVDPSDPSGNTVYVTGGTGGVWKTTNFMTQDVDGPTYQPLTDFGPTTAIHVQSLALFPRNNDPAQTIIFALTGEGNTLGTADGASSGGVGVLRSTDGGRTWKVLDSTNNQSSDPAAVPGTVGGVSDPGRDRLFVGASGFKIVVDPNPSPTGGVLVYMAITGNGTAARIAAQGGVWRSSDGGVTWTRIQAGDATDVVLAAGSASTTDPLTGQTIPNGNLQQLYAAFATPFAGGAAAGVYFTDSAPTANALNLRNGQFGLPQVRDFTLGGPNNGFPVTVQNRPSPDQVASSRIVLAAPALTSDPLLNSFYKDWLYAVVVAPNGLTAGVFETKDAGRNWTQLQLPLFQGTATPARGILGLVQSNLGYPSNNESLADVDVTQYQAGQFRTTAGAESVSLAVDPQNPAILYLGGVGGQGFPLTSGGSIRIDTTKVKDAQNFTFFNNSDPAGGQQGNTTGGAVARFGGSGAVLIGGRENTYPTDFINLSRDPNNPFLVNSTIRTVNVGAVVNDGSDVSWSPFLDILQPTGLRAGRNDGVAGNVDNMRSPATDIHTIVPFLDPTTGATRFIYGTDSGVYTGVDRGDGKLAGALGFEKVVTGPRNGNLQLTQEVSGAVQTSQLAADLAGVMFYAMTKDSGALVSSARAATTGDMNFRGPNGDAAWVEVDQTGSGTAYEYRDPSFTGPRLGPNLNSGAVYLPTGEPVKGSDNNITAVPQDFFRVLVNGSDQQFGGGIGRTNGLITTADNPAVDAGQWGLQEGYAFGVNPLNRNVLVIASRTGRVYRTTSQGNTWNEITRPGAAVPADALAFGPAIPRGSVPGQPNLVAPTEDVIYVGNRSGQLFITTNGGGQWTNISAGLDGTAVRRVVPNPATGSRELYAVTAGGVFYKADGTDAATPWVNITGNLFALTRSVFGDATDQDTALSFLTSLAVDWRLTNPAAGLTATGTTPDLYVGGQGGVFKSTDFGATWRLFPAIAQDSAVADGGYLPNVTVTDLDLSIGNINSSSGQYQAGGLNMLVASTYGRGTYAIRLTDTLPAATFISGPAVTAVINPNPTNGPSTRLQIQFSGPVDPATLTTDSIRLERVDAPAGVIPITSITAVGGTGVQNRYEITFPTQTGAAAQYRITVGYNPASPTGGVPTITDPSGFRMNQDGDKTNGEPTVDQFTTLITLNGQSQTLQAITFPGTLTAGANGDVRIEVRNAAGAVVTTANGPLNLTTTNPNAVQFFQNGVPTSTVQVTNGVAVFQIRMTAIGDYPFSAAFGVNTNPTSFTTTVTADAATSATLSPSSAAVTAGTPVSFTVTYSDQFGNPAAFTGNLTVNYGGTAPVSGQTTVASAGTSATFDVSTSAAGQATVSVTLPTAGGGSYTTTPPATIDISAGAATTVSVIPVGTGPFVIGAPVQVIVRVTDANGNLVNVNGPFTFTTGDGTAVVSPNPPSLTNGSATVTVTYGTPGSYQIRATVGATTGASGTISVVTTPPRPSPTSLLSGAFAAAAGIDGNPFVYVTNADGTPRVTLNPFPPGFNGEVDPNSGGFTGGIRVSVADVTGDGVADYVIGSGPTITATVVVYDGTTNQSIFTVQPFADFKGGVFVQTGDIDGDGVADVVITPDEGGGPRVTILKGGTGGFRQIANFFGINDPNFRGGARAALGDMNGDGFADLVVSAGFGGGPRISIYDGAALARGVQLNVIGDFFLFEPALRNGSYVALGDVNGDGLADLIGGAGPGGGPRVLVVNAATLLSRGAAVAVNSPLFNQFLGDPNNRGGVRVAAKNLDGDKFADILVGAGEGGGSRVEAYSGNGFNLLYQNDLIPGYTGGVFVG